MQNFALTSHFTNTNPKFDAILCPKIAIQLVGSNSKRAHIWCSPRNSAQRCKMSQRQVQYPSKQVTGQSSGKAKTACSGTTDADTLVFQTGRGPHTSNFDPRLKEDEQRYRHIHATRQEAPWQSGRSTPETDESWVPPDSAGTRGAERSIDIFRNTIGRSRRIQ